LRSNDPCPNCGGAKHHKGHSPTGVLRSLAAEGGVQLQSCYVQCWRILFLDNSICIIGNIIIINIVNIFSKKSKIVINNILNINVIIIIFLLEYFFIFLFIIKNIIIEKILNEITNII
jgi:hypothetical protein